MYTLRIGTLFAALAATVVHGELYFNVPPGWDKLAIKEALHVHGYEGYNPDSKPNADGLYVASHAGDKTGPHTIMLNEMKEPLPDMLKRQANQPQQPARPPMPLHIYPSSSNIAPASAANLHAPPPPPPGNPVAVPLAEAHGLQPQRQLPNVVPPQQGKGTGAMVSIPPNNNLHPMPPSPTQVANVQQPMPPPLQPPQQQQQPQLPNGVPVSKPELVITQTSSPQLVSKPEVPAAAPVVQMTDVHPSKEELASIKEGTTVVVEEEEEEEDDDEETDVSDHALSTATTTLSPTPSKDEPAKPLMLAKAGMSALKPEEMDKFSFPTDQPVVGMNGAGKKVDVKDSSEGFKGSMPGGKPSSANGKPSGGSAAAPKATNAKSGNKESSSSAQEHGSDKPAANASSGASEAKTEGGDKESAANSNMGSARSVIAAVGVAFAVVISIGIF